MISLRTTVVRNVALMVVCLLLCATTTTLTQQRTQARTTAVTPSSLQEEENDISTANTPQEEDDTDEGQDEPAQARRIQEIIVTGNNFVPTDAILHRLPYKVGEIFDPTKTRRLIFNLYYDLKRFRDISIFGENVGSDRIKLHIVVQEKNPLKEIIFEGNKQVTEKEIREKIDFSLVPAVDQEELKRFALSIKKLYRDKGYHITEVATELRVDEGGKAVAVFTITEHSKPVVKRIQFKGNNNAGAKELKNLLFTKEDWILGFMDKSGTYQEERIEGDKHLIEQFYQNKGYINGKVIDVQTIFEPGTNNITLIYEIQEGDRYTVSSVAVSGNDILNEDYLLSRMPIKAGDIYSRERLVDSIRMLEFMWGDMGYVYANVEPSIMPDEENRTVSISFTTELGKPVTLNKLTIKGNKKTRDKIIRRKLSFEEGCLITTRQMEASKTRVASLGFFDQREGVNWKMTRLSEDSADLDLIVKEVKTGNAHLQLGFGGSAVSITSQTTGVSVEGSITDTNLFGSGMKMNLTGRLGTDEKTIFFNLTQPWLFDKPIYAAMDIYHKRVAYDELRLTNPVNEKYTGGSLTGGFVTSPMHSIFNDTFVRCGLSIDNVEYERGIPKAYINGLGTRARDLEATNAYNIILAKEFNPGAYVTLSSNVGKDLRNHPMHPTNGYSWLGRSILALPALQGSIKYYKADVDLNWYTPLIGEYDLILRLHGYFGAVVPFHGGSIPYRELFHIGGPASVRGFLYGQIGPQFAVEKNSKAISDSIGGRNTFFVNVEMIFPITQDFSMKGICFYDGGAGWNNPFADSVPGEFIRNNILNYRHAVGVGFRLLNPMPIRVDWGFKLDAKKGEPASEVHFGMSYDW